MIFELNIIFLSKDDGIPDSEKNPIMPNIVLNALVLKKRNKCLFSIILSHDFDRSCLRLWEYFSGMERALYSLLLAKRKVNT